MHNLMDFSSKRVEDLPIVLNLDFEFLGLSSSDALESQPLRLKSRDSASADSSGSGWL